MEASKKNKVIDFLIKNIIFVVLILLVVVIAIMEPSFLSLRVLRDLLLQNATRLIIASGMAFILISGGVDLGAGRLVGLAAVLSATMSQTLT